jgi:hypothetical protein
MTGIVFISMTSIPEPRRHSVRTPHCYLVLSILICAPTSLFGFIRHVFSEGGRRCLRCQNLDLGPSLGAGYPTLTSQTRDYDSVLLLASEEDVYDELDADELELHLRQQSPRQPPESHPLPPWLLLF